MSGRLTKNLAILSWWKLISHLITPKILTLWLVLLANITPREIPASYVPFVRLRTESYIATLLPLISPTILTYWQMSPRPLISRALPLIRFTTSVGINRTERTAHASTLLVILTRQVALDPSRIIPMDEDTTITR